MKLDSHINKIENTSKNNKNGESSSVSNKISSKIPYKKIHKRNDSLNSFFSIKSTNIFNRHKKFLDDNFRDTKSDNNIDLYSPDYDNINKFDIKSISSKNNRKNVKDSLSTPKKKYSLKDLLKVEKKHNKHVSVPIFNLNLRNHRRSASTSVPVVSPVLSKITSHLKSSINLINNHSNSSRFNDKINFRSSETASLSNLPITTTIVSTPMSLPAVVRKNSTSTIEPPVITSPSTPLINSEVQVNEPLVITSSTTPLMNPKVPIYNLSYGHYSRSTPSLRSYPTPDKTPSNLTPNSSKSTPSTRDEIIHSSKSLNQSTQSLQQTFVPEISTSPLISSKFESESKNKINGTRIINHQSITSLKNTSTFSNIQESNSNTNNSTSKNEYQSQEMESSISTLNSKKELSNKNQEIENIDQVGMCNTGCSNTSDDKVSELKEDINSTAIINKDNTTYSLFMPKSVIEKGSLQNSMQKEINGIIEYYDQSTLNEFSSIDPNKEDIPSIGNKLLLTYLNKNFKNENNEIKNGTTYESNNQNNQSETVYQENSQTELDSSALKEQKIYISDIDIACLDINKIKGDLSQSININDKIPINDSINMNTVAISSLNSIPEDVNNPHVVKSSKTQKKLNTELSKTTLNQVILNPSSIHNEGSIITTTNTSANVNTNTRTNINYDINYKKSNNYNDSYLNEKINHQTLTKLLRGDETTNSSENTKKESGINNKIKNQTKEENSCNNDDKKESNEKKPYINVKSSSCPKKNIIKGKKNGDDDNDDNKIKDEVEDENKNKSLIKNENKLVSPLNSTQIVIPDFPSKPIINHYKHQSQPQQLSSSFAKHYHHFSEGFGNQRNQEGKSNKGNTDDELFKEEVNQIESLNSLKTALLFLSKNEANSIKGESSNRMFDSGSSLFSSKRKSTNIVSNSVFNSNGHNRKYLSLPAIFSSSNHNVNNININTNINNIILPLTTTEEGKLIYPVDRLDSGRKLRAYYGIECPILLSDGSKSKINDYNGTPQIQNELLDKEKNESFDKKKNSKFVKRLTSFLHLGNNTSNNDATIKDTNKKKFKNNEKDEITKKEECAVEYVPVQKDSNENNNNLLSLYNNQGDIIPSDHFNNIQSNNNKIIVPVKNARTTKDIYGNEIKNISDLIKFYDKDSEIYSSREFSYKDSFSYTHNSQSITKNPSVYTKDETKTTFSMIPSRLRNVITTPSYKISFCDTEPYLSSFSFEHSISEYSSSESSFDISNHQINIKKVMARTSTTASTQNKINKPSIIEIKNGRPLELDNSYNIQKIPDTEEEINEDNIQFNMVESLNEQENSSFNDICKHSSSKIIDSDIDSLFLYPSNINELPDVAVPRQEIRHKIENNKNKLHENINTSLTEEEIKSTLFKDLYDKSLIKDSMMSNTTTTSYSYDSYDQSDHLLENSYSFLLDEIYNGNGKNIHKTLKLDNDERSDSESSSDEDYNFYDPPEDMDYSDNYLETRKKKFKLKKPIRSKNSKFSTKKNNSNNINDNNEIYLTKPNKTSTKRNDDETIQLPTIPVKCKARTSSLDANISKDQPSTSIPDKKNVKTTTTTRTTTTIYKHPNEAKNSSNNQPITKNKYSIKNTETKTTIIEEEDEDDGYSSSMSITSINTELMISVTAQPKTNLNKIKIPNIGERKSSLSAQSQPISPLVNINNNNTIMLSDANTEKIIKNNSYALSKEQKNIKECQTNSSYNNNDVNVNVDGDGYGDGDNDDKNNAESMDIESDIDLVMKGDQSDYDLNLEEDEDDDDETQSISLIKNHIKNSNTLHQNLIIERKYNKTQRKESGEILQHLPIPTKDTKLFEKQNIFSKNDKESLNSSLYSHHSNSSTSSEDEGINGNKSNIKNKNNGVNHLEKDLNENNYYHNKKLPYPYSQSISSSLSSIPISGKYEKEDNFDNYSYSLSSYSQSDYYEETDTEYSFISNNVKLYHRHKAKHHTKNDKNVLYQKGDGIDELLKYQTERNNEEYCSTEILSYDNYLNKFQYNNEAFDINKIENPERYHNLLSKFLLELLKNKCSEYFFLFHDMIQFQYKEFQCCDQFTNEGQEIFNTYLTNTSTLKINVDTKLVHKIAYGIKYYDRCCFIPLINMVLKILESKYLKYGIHQYTFKESDHKNKIMQEYCKVLDEHYSSNINSVKILNGEESPNQIYRTKYQ
jgi:hypothetical protein